MPILLQDAIDDLQVTKDSNERTGFPNKTDATRLFVDATRTFSLTPIATSYNWYETNKEYTSTGQSLQITDVTGVHVLYENAGVLSEYVNPSAAETAVAIRTKALVAIIYWNATASEAIYVGEERHGMQMDGATHTLLHYTNGLAWLNGLALVDIDVDADGDDVASAQLGVASGSVSDEDLMFSIDAHGSTVAIPVFYMSGTEAEPVWNRTITTNYPARTVDGTSATMLAYNLLTGGNWTLDDPGNADYILYHYFATTDPDQPIIAIMGQNQYANKGDVREGALSEIFELVGNANLTPEIKALGTVLFQTLLAYDNLINARTISTDSGGDYEDWRASVTRTTK